jgi:adenine-specific DNA-methyltransferase
MNDHGLKRIVASLGPPAHRGDGYVIYRGDCTQLLRNVDTGSIPLTVTSPPYNIGKEYENRREIEDYLAWCRSWIGEVHRSCSATGSFWLNVGYIALPGKAKAIPLPYLLWPHSPFFLLQEIVWHYGAGVAARSSFSPRNEKFLWYVKDDRQYTFNLDAVRDPNVKYPNQKKNGKVKCNPAGKNPSDVWHFAKVTSGRDRSSQERTAHPAQFPVAVIDRIIRACSNPGDTVLDPFVGSGTTIEAAIMNGRCAVGFEIRSDYVEIAANRVERFLNRRTRASAQQALF